MTKLISVLSDTHLTGAKQLPAVVVRAIARGDMTIHAGDISTRDALAEIEAIGPPVHAVQGNVDDPSLCRTLPAELHLEIESVHLVVLHDAGGAAGRLSRLRRRFPDADAVIFGHSHMPLHETDDGFQIFNPGSPTQRRRAPRHSMGVAEVEGSEIRFMHLPV